MAGAARTSQTTGARSRVTGDARPVGRFFKAASARKLVGCFVGPVDLAEQHSAYLKAKLRGRAKNPR